MRTLQEFKDYILSELGSPLIQIEVTDTQIESAINDAIQKFTEYSYGDLEDKVIVEINGIGEYDLPERITNILAISKGGSASNITNFSANYGDGYVPNIWSQQFFSGSLTGNIIPSIVGISNTKATLDKYFGNALSHNFNAHKASLNVLEEFNGPVLIHYQYEYLANPEGDKIFNHEWVKSYSVALVKKKWGNNIGKFSQSLVGGATLNFDRIISEADSEIDRLNEELLTKWSDPAPISIA